MRYFIATYYRKADGKVDEHTTVARNIKPRDLQSANIILDFKKLSVVKCVMDGQAAPKDWDRVISYYYKYYPAVITRLFKENGYEVKMEESGSADTG